LQVPVLTRKGKISIIGNLNNGRNGKYRIPVIVFVSPKERSLETAGKDGRRVFREALKYKRRNK